LTLANRTPNSICR